MVTSSINIHRWRKIKYIIFGSIRCCGSFGTNSVCRFLSPTPHSKLARQNNHISALGKIDILSWQTVDGFVCVCDFFFASVR